MESCAEAAGDGDHPAAEASVADHASGGSIALADLAERTDTLIVACSRCERTGRYPVAKLILRYGHAFGVPHLLRELSADSTKRASISAYDFCGIHAPELSALFLGGPNRSG